MTASQRAQEITVLVNGQALRLPAGSTIRTLRDLQGYPEQGIAIAVNREVIPRSRHGEHALRDGDSIDAVQAVGGG